jgi:ribokinase
MPKPIVVVGSINLDLVATSAHLPAPGETVIGTAFNTFFGGKGANQAVAAAKLGYPVTMIGKVGQDAFGSQLIEGLRECGVEVSRIQKVGGSSGVALILTDQQGENSIVVIPGANGALTPADLDESRDILRGAGMILAQLEIPMETVLHLAGCANNLNIPLMLDPAPARPLSVELLKKVTWITPNETEAGLLLVASNTPKADQQIADELLNSGVRHVILKLGSRGVLVAENHNSKIHVPAYRVTAVDTTAAGDAFNGAFAVATMEGKPPVDAARFANAVAAISITRRGAQPSMPSRHEVESFLREQPAD